jgi:polyvinyl alcohol dehydrogenase (cytochrome)
MVMKRRLVFAVALTALAASQFGVAHSQPPAGEVVLISQNEELDAYDSTGVLHWEENAFVDKHEWVNGPPCYLPAPNPEHHFLEADDNEENGQEGADFPWWGEFNVNGEWTGSKIRDADAENPQGTLNDPSGCVFDAAGNFFGVDVGEVHAPLIGDGQLIEFFKTDPANPLAAPWTSFCRIATDLSQPGMVAFDTQGRLYVPQAGAGVITRYSDFPANASECESNPPAAETWMIGPAQGIGTPIAIAQVPGSTDWAVASVLVPGGIFRVSADGIVVGTYAAPGPQTGTPFGIAFDSAGNLYYADLGVRPWPLTGGEDPSEPIGTADGQGALKMVPAGGAPFPITIQAEMNFPDGVAVVPADWVNVPAGAGCDWPMYGNDLGRSFGATPGCARINQLNVSTLRPKWFVNTSSPVTASPAVVGGKVYVGAYDGTFYKIDAATGNQDATFSVTDQTQNDYGKIVSSAAVDTVQGTRVVVFGGGSTLYVLDADLNPIISACLDPRPIAQPCQIAGNETVEIESSPAIVNLGSGGARIIVGMDFNEDAGVGRAGVLSFKLQFVQGQWKLTPEWKFDPETLQTYTKSATVNPITAGGTGTGCGNVWSSPTVDRTSGLVFFGVGNCDIVPDPLEAGDGEAIVAVHLNDGTLAWRYAPRAADNDLDLDFGATPNLLPGGRVGEGGKDGFYYGLPRTSATTAATPDWSSHVSTASDIGGIIGSTAVGEVKGRQAVFATSAVPFSTRDPEGTFADAFISEEGPGNPAHVLALHAIDALTGENLWDAPIPLPSYSAATYANGVVFIGDTFGSSVQAYNADTGLPLWAFPVNGAPSSGVTIVGDSIYLGSGTAAGGIPFLDQVGGIWSFQLAG